MEIQTQLLPKMLPSFVKVNFYNTTRCRFDNFSLRFVSFLSAFLCLILCFFSFRAFFRSTMIILPFGGGLLLENKVGATDSRAAW